MKIQYTQHVADPSLRNTITHLPAHVAQVLIASGQARHIPFKNAVERLNYEMSLLANAPVVVEWGVREADGSAHSVNVVIKTTGSEQIFYDAPPADAPDFIKVRFAAAQQKNSAAVRAANDADRNRVEAERAEERTRELNAKY